MSYEYIANFKKMGFGLFVHFGIYSVAGKGEWYFFTNKLGAEEYNSLASRFYVAEDWAERLVHTAKEAGCRYITLTTRHHDGFSLYDTKGLNDFDAPHSACKRDLVREFVDACNAGGITPMFYHTLLDWQHPAYQNDFPAYIDYLVESITILCTNYGRVGGFWFDGKWDKEEDWQEDRIYGTIRRLQPDAMIINNTGLDAVGKTGHPELDSVTFERGKPFPVVSAGKPLAGEVCQVITDHWGYAENDICVKSMSELINTLVDCRACGCNLLLNTGPRGDGTITPYEEVMLRNIGKWIRINQCFIYDARPANMKAENADIVTDGAYYYALIRNVPMALDANVTRMQDSKIIVVHTDCKIQDAIWLDNGEKVMQVNHNSFYVQPFSYGISLGVRVARFQLGKNTVKEE